MIAWRRVLAIGGNDLRILSRDPLPPVSLFFVTPLLLMAFVKPIYRPVLVEQGTAGASGVEQAVPGLAVMFTLFAIGYCGFFYFREHGLQTWDRLRTNARPTELVLGKLLAPLLLLVAQQAVLLGLGGALFGLHVPGSVPALALVAVVFCCCVVALSVALVALCRTIMQLNALSNISALLLGGIGGAVAPIAVLPGWARHLSPATPSYWAMRGYRGVILDGARLGDVVEPVLVLVALTVAFTTVGVLRLRVADEKISWT